MQDNTLAIELLVNQNVQVIFEMLDVDGDVDALALKLDGDWVAVVLVFKEQCEFLVDAGKLVRYKCETEFQLAVAIDFNCSFELNLRQELFETDFLLRYF